MKNNDDDIKIFHPSKKKGADRDFTELAALMDTNRRNGNLTKATFLGERLAGILPEDFRKDDVKKLNNSELLQLRTLMIFSAQTALYKYLPHTILSTQATNSMYGKIEELSPAFFSGICDGSAFGFYYLSIRKPENVAAEIGKNYAMLCDRDDNAYFIELGKSTFSAMEAKVISLIEEFEFEKL